MDNQLRVIQNSPIFLVLKVVIGGLILFHISSLLRRAGEKTAAELPEINTSNETTAVESKEEVKETIGQLDLQPCCHISYTNVILKEILLNLYVKREMCTPEDIYNAEKHKIPRISSRTNKIAEPKGTMVVYIAVGLLLTSLGAAFVEVFKAKRQPTTKSRPPLTRTCSLADLTVLRHNRKESMRRESIMEGADHRGPSKLLDKQTPLMRRCSFPVGPGDFSYSHGPSYGFPGSRSVSRKTSIDNEGMFQPEHRHTHFRLLHRH